MYPILGRNLQ